MVPFLLAIGSALLGLGAVGAGAQAVVASVPIGLWKENEDNKRNFRLGLNPQRDLHRVAEAVRAAKAGIPPAKQEKFEVFKFQSGDLPESWDYLLKQKWCLTEFELYLLYSMVRRQMMDQKIGPYAEAGKRFCESRGLSYEELAEHSRLLSGLIDFRDLIWFSDNRLADPTILEKLKEAGYDPKA